MCFFSLVTVWSVSDMGSEHYCLRWNNHQNNLLGVFSQLLRDESLVDVTLACSEGHSIRAHKVVLSACSSYFQTLFVDHPSRHPIVILKDVRFSELRTLIEFMYKGEVNVEYCQLSALLKTAESLKVKGLAEMTNLGPGSGDYKQEEPEQTEPTELVSKRPPQEDIREQQQHVAATASTGTVAATTTTPPPTQQPPPSSQTTPKVCKSPPERSPPSIEPVRSDTPIDECGPSDMSIHNNSNVSSCSAALAAVCNRISSPINNEPLPGPSNMPPVQQVPLVSSSPPCSKFMSGRLYFQETIASGTNQTRL